MAKCAHPEPEVVKRMVSFSCPACGEMWAEKDDVGNYKSEYEAEHQKVLELEETNRRGRNAATESYRLMTEQRNRLEAKLRQIRGVTEEK